MSSKTRQYAARQYAAGSVPKGHARAAARKRARQGYGRRQGLPWFKIGVGSFAFVLVALQAFNFANTGYGKITAESSSYEFGDVPFKGGFIFTQFPITVDGDVTVNDIVST